MKYEHLIRRNNFQSGDFSLPGVKRKYAPDLKLEPIHTEIHLNVDLIERMARGYALLTIRVNVDGVHHLNLDAMDFENLEVKSTSTGKMSHTYDGKIIKLHFEDELKSGDEKIIRIDYAVQDPISGIIFSQPDTQRPDLPLYAITDNETERARYWFPCVDFPSVRSTMEYFLSANEDLTILANGALISEEISAGVKTSHWKLDYPCPSYLTCFAIGEFSEYQDEPLRDMPIAYFADKSYTSDQLKRTFGATRDMLIWMEKKLGMDFPYPKYFQLAGREIGGAMENISLVTWDDKFMLDETMASEWQYIMDLVNVHEMSHSYFGDAIVSYDFAHVWLKESWATYIESVWLEDSVGIDAMHWQLSEEAASYIDEAKNDYVRPIITREYDHSWSMFDMHLYPGGAWRLHMLRNLVGDEKFWAGVQDYVNQYAGTTVKSLDFQRCIEKRSGLNLDSFFDMWFKSKGYPILKVSFEFDKEKKRGKFTIEQKQIDKNRGVELFDMDLELAWQDNDGKDHVEVVHLHKQEQVFQIKMDEPKHVMLDPDMKALFESEFNPGDEKLRHLLHNGKTIKSLMQAISELAKTGKRKNLLSIHDYLKNESRWGLRIHAYRALGKVGNEYAFDHLSNLLIAESDSMVIEAAAKACGSYPHPKLRDAIIEKLEQQDLPYRGQMALLESLGKQRKLEDINLLASYAKQDGWRNLVRAGAYLGLGATRSEKAVESLLEDIEKPVHFWDEKVARLIGVQSIRDWLPEHLKNRVSQALCEATQDPSYYVHFNAARHLGSAGITEGLPYLNALTNRIPEQDYPFLQRQINAIQAAGDGSPDKKLQKQLDELKEKFAEMEKRLQEVESE